MSQPETRIGRRFQALREEGRSGLVTFLTAGDPDPDTALEIFKGLPNCRRRPHRDRRALQRSDGRWPRHPGQFSARP